MSQLLKFNNFFKQCVTNRLELATLRLREKHHSLLSHGGVLFLRNPGRLSFYRAPPNLLLQQASWIFSVLGITGMAGVRGTQM